MAGFKNGFIKKQQKMHTAGSQQVAVSVIVQTPAQLW